MPRGKTETYCAKCDDWVEVEAPWGDVECPKCHRKGYWDDHWDGEDEWTFVEWESYE